MQPFAGKMKLSGPIKLKSHKVLIGAPREMVYQKMTAFGRGRLQGDNAESSRVLCRDGNGIIAEFKTKAGPFTYTTIEQVTLEPLDRIAFEHLSGPLHYAREEFLFRDVDGGMELVHNGEFIWSRFPYFGWLGGRIYTKPVFERAIEKHLEQVKVTCEARASRSHVFPSSSA